MTPFEWFIVLIATTLIARALAPKPPQPKPAALEDFDIPVAERGKPMGVVFGTVIIESPNTLSYGDLNVTAIRKEPEKK
jgi:hypothetical protein